MMRVRETNPLTAYVTISQGECDEERFRLVVRGALRYWYLFITNINAILVSNEDILAHVGDSRHLDDEPNDGYPLDEFVGWRIQKDLEAQMFTSVMTGYKRFAGLVVAKLSASTIYLDEVEELVEEGMKSLDQI